MNTSMTIDSPQITSSGPKCLSDGRSRTSTATTASIAAARALGHTAVPRTPQRSRNSERRRRRRSAPSSRAAPDRLPPDEHRPRVVQVARQEDDDADLRELGRLEADRPEVDRQVGAVGRAADPGDPRQEQQHDRRDGDHVAVALERAVVAQEHDRGAEEQRARRRTRSPARSPARGRSGRSSPGRTPPAARRAGTGRGPRRAAGRG